MGPEFEPGDLVENPAQPDWGIGQVQSRIDGKVTVNFEHVGKMVILSHSVSLRYAQHDAAFGSIDMA